jgi:hypothetical protein
MADDREILRFEVIVVAMAEYPDTTAARVTIGTNDEPDQARETELKAKITDLYREAFEEEPARVAVAVLPWSEPEPPEHDRRRDDPDYEGEGDDA